jgi:PIN domain nuclease of toxin-antitoxin system
MPNVERLVLDTHVWLDVAFGRGRLAPRLIRRINAAAFAGELYVAAITAWETAMLVKRGKLKINGPTIEWMHRTFRDTRTAVAPLDVAIAIDAVELPAWTHADPADRLIVATARQMNAVLVTRDEAILEYAYASKAVRTLDPS